VISTRAAAAVGLLWGFAEGLFFFVVPDVFITLVAAVSPRRGAVAWVASIAGSVLAVGAACAIVSHHPGGYRAFLIAQPGITEDLARRVEAAVAQGGLPVTPLLALGGVPLKLYAFSAFSAGLSLPAVLIWTLFARFVRILPAYSLFALVGRVFKGPIAARPRTCLALFAGAWSLFYCLYFARMGW
jgi:hypothetical protein